MCRKYITSERGLMEDTPVSKFISNNLTLMGLMSGLWYYHNRNIFVFLHIWYCQHAYTYKTPLIAYISKPTSPNHHAIRIMTIGSMSVLQHVRSLTCSCHPVSILIVCDLTTAVNYQHADLYKHVRCVKFFCEWHVSLLTLQQPVRQLPVPRSQVLIHQLTGITRRVSCVIYDLFTARHVPNRTETCQSVVNNVRTYVSHIW